MSETIIVSNRLPVSVKKTKQGLEIYPSSGGLATAMASYSAKRGSIWIGWPGIVSDNLTEDDEKQIAEQLKTYRCVPVFLSQKQLDQFYNGYSNNILWPLFHNLPTDLPNEVRDFKVYKQVNDIFCDAVLSISTDHSDIWIHDYQLMLLPQLLREQHAGDNIGYFHHIPWPEPSQLSRLKNAAELIRGILGTDLVGFHTKDYTQYFLECANSLNIGTPAKGGIARRGRVVRVTDFPIGIDYNKFAVTGRTHAVHKEARRLQKKYKNLKIILTVDRLDPTKGFMERLKAYETFLNDSPDMLGKVVMVMIAVPSRGEIDAYRKLKQNVERKIRDINKTFGTKRWRPIDYMYTTVTFDELNALYKIADIGFVAPIKDGMNLVAKEFVASQTRKDGILILSRTAGASQELKDALLVNPTQPHSLVRGLKRAINMPKKELRERVILMQATISKNTAQYWSNNFMRSLRKAGLKNQASPLNLIRSKQLLLDYESATKRLLILDYDGVLKAFAARPELAAPNDNLIKLIKDLGSQPQTDIAIISGRSQANLEDWFGKLPVSLVAEHGAVSRIAPDEDWKTNGIDADNWKTVIMPALERYASKAPGAFVEEKAFSLVWHYRQTTNYYAQKNIAQIKRTLQPTLKKYGLKIFTGNKILEIKSPETHKGAAVKVLLKKPYDFILVMGDDYTDEDMFTSSPKYAYTIKVGPDNTIARYRIKNVPQVHELLYKIVRSK